MAGQLYKPGQSVDPYLSPNQQDLLLAALNSQARNKRTPPPQAIRGTQADSHPQPSQLVDNTPTMDTSATGALLMSPQDADLDSYGVDMSPDLDCMDGDHFDFENADLGGEMIGALPTSADAKTSEGHEKRKSPDENDGSEEGDSKRQETTQDGEKQAKKPGRKPLTSEPTTKRKAQNRAAQRAFRERKEKHLKDLESKVSELTKASEADKHENGLLKAQVERLQVELREYRKRLSLNSSSVSRSPPLSGVNGQQRSNSNPSYGNTFQFDFPKFGGLPGSHIFGNSVQNNGVLKRDSATPPTHSPINGTTTVQANFVQSVPSFNSRSNSTGQSMSPRSNGGSVSNADSPSQFANLNPTFSAYSTNDNMHGFASTLPQMHSTGSSDPFGDLFSPSILKSTSPNTSYFENSQENPSHGSGNLTNPDVGNDSTSGLNRVFQFNGGSNASDSTSPSASSSSQWNVNGTGNSSCETSPEPSHDSPVNKDSDKAPSQKHFGNNGTGHSGLDATFGLGNVDFNVPSFNNFDPVLFGDYRDNNDAFLGGGGNFSSGFFDDALNQPFDMGSPSNLFGILQSPRQTQSSLSAPGGSGKATTPSKNLMAEVEKVCGGGDDDYGMPRKTESTAKLISCNNIWNQLQSNPDFQEGKFDLDNLCSELRSKARCSESGVMVEQSHVDQALRRLGKKDATGKAQDVPPLMFEQESWDNVLKKLQSGKN